ncbi:23S ribosomal RNA methyltransferase Erm [Mycolicibacterium flavescens]|uniref:23S ribosomal RNA methyltransferase Erm n=1 Tax=Mycolicibacterium flavescens TaxID=1776 RepID=A0A1E3RGY2_MYCFV|nr:23S ribosomal RNA methyltransferase Erm [Mycolicibacterium flavescens]MCV7279234.1 23S ribosomal RNA methyltransferase Erm [Mycolicibacterium flavescens]ODQ89089.1 23S ribosomal RNA methyltransferase Erm [Mycolicibacterium flavescens]
MPSPHHGRHEFGQNFIRDRRVINTIVDLVAQTTGPIIEIGAGDGALTLPLQRLRRPLTAIEVDARRAVRLDTRTAATTNVVTADFLTYRLPATPHVVVGNLPFHQTTAMLRRLLHSPGWTDAVLLVQWEVARRRAGVGGATMMTAQWWPWFEFALAQRVPAAAFTPRPGVDGGLITVRRRADPLVDHHDRHRYQRLVHRVFTGRGRGIAQIVGGVAPRDVTRRWLRDNRIRVDALPRDLSAPQWASLLDLSDGPRDRGDRGHRQRR